MHAVIKGILAAAILTGGSLAGTAPAEARDHTGTAIAAGIIGLGIGAAIASSDHHDRYYGNGNYGYDNYGYDSYGYSAPGYYVAPAYGYGVTYERGYYGRNYYDGRHDHRHWRDHDRRDYGRGHRDYDRGDWDHDRRW